MLMNEKNSTVILRCSPRSGEPRRIGHSRQRPRPSFETPRKSAAPQDDVECVEMFAAFARHKIGEQGCENKAPRKRERSRRIQCSIIEEGQAKFR
jgi:hypothetical protein